MSDILTFLWAVLNNWAGYSTGGLLVATAGFWVIWRDKPLPRIALLILSGLFLVMALYRGWRDQHDRVRQLSAELVESKANRFKPLLKFNVYNGGFGPFPQRGNASLLFLDIGVRNTGSPTSLREWEVAVIGEDKTYLGEITLFDKPVSLSGRSEDGARVVHPEDFLPERTLTPIATGGETTGTLFAIMNDLPIEFVREKTSTVKVKCKDVDDNPYEFESQIISHGLFNPYLRIPGMKRPDSPANPK